MTKTTETNFKKGARFIQEFTRSPASAAPATQPQSLDDYHKILQLVATKINPSDPITATATAVSILRHLVQQSGLVPTVDTMNLLVQCASPPKMAQPLVLISLIKEIRKAYIPLDINAFNALLQTTHEKMDENDLAEFITAMRESKVPPDETTFDLITKSDYQLV